ncbi:hypothetical protein N9Y42_01825 [Mariniblastus sp.]|nr:hypothetical protein [Mariniblastus sp.]
MPNNIIQKLPPEPADYLPFLFAQATTAGTPSEKCSFELVVSLAAKGFVILTGPSGTGKSRSSIELGQALDATDHYENESAGSSYCLVPVAADWTDARPILGYASPFGRTRTFKDGSKTNDTYEVTDALKLIIRAAGGNASNSPHLLILDEMNLSHVERYFSPFLSLIEANRASTGGAGIPLISHENTALISTVLADSNPNSIETIAAQEIAADSRGIPIPDNIFLVGTVNIDETTYMFSPKVLDRAFVLELGATEPVAYFEESNVAISTMTISQAHALLSWSTTQRQSKIFEQHPNKLFEYARDELSIPTAKVDEIRSSTLRLLQGSFRLLEPIGFAFGFRVINEFCSYMICWLKAIDITDGDIDNWPQALDSACMQKLLPKIHGNRRQLGDCLNAMLAFLSGGHGSSDPPAKYQIGNAVPVTIPQDESLSLSAPDQMFASRNKITRMQQQLKATGYTTFIQ